MTWCIKYLNKYLNIETERYTDTDTQTHARTHTRTHTRTHAHAQAHAHAHTIQQLLMCTHLLFRLAHQPTNEVGTDNVCLPLSFTFV